MTQNLNQKFNAFKTAGIQELILDLRYNYSGSVSSVASRMNPPQKYFQLYHVLLIVCEELISVLRVPARMKIQKPYKMQMQFIKMYFLVKPNGRSLMNRNLRFCHISDYCTLR